MKPFAKFILSFTTLLPIIATADELPNSAFKELINIRETHHKNASSDNIDSYYFLYGLALKNDNLVNTGRAYFDNELAYSKSKTSYQEHEKIHKQTQLEFEKLDLSQSSDKANLFCGLNENNCIKVLFDNQQYWQPTIEKYNILLNRYQEFLNREPAVTDYLITQNSPMPSYYPLIMAQRLTHLSYLNAEDKTVFVNELEKEQVMLKNQLKWADSLIQKVIIQRMLANNLQITVLLKTRFGLNFNTPVSNLTTAEKSLRLPLSYEFVWYEQEIKKQNKKLKNYQHYTTFNGIATHYLNQIKLSEQSAIEIGKYQINYQKTQNSIKINKKHNKTGFILANNSAQNYVDYAQNLNELDNVINMTNYILTDNDKYLINVFTGDKKGIIQDNEKICMPMPRSRGELTQTCVYL